jgi:entry exclusion lipoprotein TrbK
MKLKLLSIALISITIISGCSKQDNIPDVTSDSCTRENISKITNQEKRNEFEDKCLDINTADNQNSKPASETFHGGKLGKSQEREW